MSESPPNATDYKSRLQLAAQAVRQLRERLEKVERGRFEPIAIIGIGCRFPGGESGPEEIWRALYEGRDAVCDFPASRGDFEAWYDPDPDAPGKAYVGKAGYLSHVDEYDAAFFGISPRQAVAIDPQQRLMTEVAWEALEHAGIAPTSLRDTLGGVFVGVSTTDYARLRQQADPAMVDAFQLGAEPSFAAGGLAYLFGLHGPALTLDTACSSSLVAVHLACRSLRSRECDLAMAGGVNLILNPYGFVLLSKARALSPVGRCSAFDAAADGYVRGEGCGIVVLKRLSDAVAARDNIVAVIRGTAVNHDGRTAGPTVPNGLMQQAVIRDALKDASITPDRVCYVEAHGTGTALGDPIELRALEAVYGGSHSPENPLLVGSLKTNIGHLEAAAGVGGLIKAALTAQHKIAPPNLHFHVPNLVLPWNKLPIKVPIEPTTLTNGEQPVCVGVSSFGASGTNAHVVLEQYCDEHSDTSSTAAGARAGHLLALSAKSSDALKTLVQSYASKLHDLPDADWDSLCRTAATGRAHFPNRAVVWGDSGEQVRERLHSLAAEEQSAGVITQHVDSAPVIAFLLDGQGSQYAGMGRELYQQQPVFRQALEQCAELLKPHLDVSLLEVLHADDGDDRLRNTRYSQPAIFSIDYALATLWQHWGVRPAAIIGHSLGEYVAACLAGVWSLPDALALVAQRARLMESLQGGAMASIEASSDPIEQSIAKWEGRVSIAAINSPRDTVVSGDAEAVQSIAEEFKSQGAMVRQLEVSGGFHSRHVEPLVEQFAKILATVKFNTPQIPIASNLTGELDDGQMASPEYWLAHMRQPVRFYSGMQALEKLGANTFLEVGPSRGLIAMAMKCMPEQRHWFSSMRRSAGDRRCILENVAGLYARGVDIDWQRYFGPRKSAPLRLPTYPFKRKRFWFDSQKSSAPARRRSASETTHPFLAKRLNCALPTYEVHIEPKLLRLIATVERHGCIMVPNALIAAMAVVVGREQLGCESPRISRVEFMRPLIIPAGQGLWLQLVVDSRTPREASCRCFSNTDTGIHEAWPWTCNATARLDAQSTLPPPVNLEEILSQCDRKIPDSQSEQVEWIQVGDRQVVAKTRILESAATTTDASLQAAQMEDLGLKMLTALDANIAGPLPLICRGSGRFAIRSASDRAEWCHLKLTESNDKTMAADVRLLDEKGEVLAEGLDVRFAPVEMSDFGDALRRPVSDLFYELSWSPVPLPPAAEETAVCQRVVVVRDSDDFADQLVAALRPSAEQWITVFYGDRFEKRGDDEFVIRPASQDDVQELFNQLNPGDTPWHIIHCATLGAPSANQLTLEQLRQQGLAADNALLLAQAAQRAAAQLPARLWLVTRGAQAIGTAAPNAIAASTLWGIGRAVSMEHPEIWGGLVDLDPLSADSDNVNFLHSAMRARASGDDQRAVREGIAYAPRLLRVELPAETRPVAIRDDAQYLLVGGLGGLGKEVANWLIDHGARRLIITSKRGIPPRSEWESDQLDDETRQRISAVNDLRNRGAEVEVIAADTSDPDRMAEVLREIEQSPLPLKGIVHLAGLAGAQLLAETNLATFRSVLEPKVLGAWNVHLLTQHMELDFFVCFSSIASVWGSQRLVSYCAANHFLDQLAFLRRASGLAATTVAWGPWFVKTSLAGEEELQFLLSIGLRPLSAEQGVSLLGLAAGSQKPHLVAVAVEWARFKTLMELRGPSPMLAEITFEDPRSLMGDSKILEDLRQADEKDRRGVLTDYVMRSVASALQVDPSELSPSVALLELGVDSLMALEVMSRCKTELLVTLSPADFYECTTIESFITMILQRVPLEPQEE